MAVLMSPQLDTSIEGIDENGNAMINGGIHLAPPDPTGAAGPAHVLNATNISIQWFTKAGVQQVETSLNSFFRALNPAPNPALFDPKVTYDQYNGRFIVVVLEQLDIDNGDAVNSSRVLVAVSDDSDPNGVWNFQAFNTLQVINAEPQWLDYPGLAVDANALYITGNMFPFGDGAAAAGGSRLLIINKGAGSNGLYDGGFSTMNIYNPAGNSAATTGFTLQPAQTYGTVPNFGTSPIGTWFTAYNGATGGTGEQLMVIRVDNPLTTPTFFMQNVQLGDIDNATNLGYPTVLAPSTLGAPQPGSTVLIETNDRRTLNAIWRDNALWTVFQVIPPSGPDVGQTTVHWVKIDTSNPSTLVVADQGNIGAEEIGGTVYTSMPSIAVDAAGNATVGFAASGPAIFAGAYYATRSATDPAGTFRVPRAMAAGVDTYVFDPARNRWGDYSATVLDPADGVTFWMYNQYAKPKNATDDGRWGTRWGSIHIGALPPDGGGGGGGGGGGSAAALVRGTKWSDADKDGVRDASEVGVAGFTIYVDANGNDTIDVGEPAAITDSDGNYTISSNVFGTFAVREVGLAGWVQTFPGQSSNFETAVTLVSGQTVSNIDFGNNGVVYDFGDAPAPYPTKLEDSGARHAVRNGLHLGPPTVGAAAGTSTGVEPDVEADGQQDPNAQGDDLSGVDDEDGVFFATNSLIAGKTASIPVTISTGGLSAAALQAWIDFNGDGDWSDPGEQVVKDRVLTPGVGKVTLTTNITFPVPANATRNATYARFRYGYERGIGPTGIAIAGEVEDYKVQILTDEPQANDDTYTVNQNSINNILAVLDNDFASSNGSLQIDSFATPTANGGTVVLGDNGTPLNKADDVLLYTPLNGYFGPDSFTYLVSDGTGKSDSATVTLTVVSILNDPIAVDDSIVVPVNSLGQVTPTQLRVLANDITGNRPPILISSVTQPSSGQGTVSIVAGGTQLLYTPPSQTFAGDIQFTYTIADRTTPTPKTSTAEVTLHVGNSTTDDLIQIRLQAFDLNGNAISVINPDQDFEMRAFVKDIRTDDTVGAPTDRLGVYAAYFDMLFDSKLVSIAGPIEFNGAIGDPFKPWTAGQSVNTSTPGNLNEVGAFQGSSPLFSQNFVLLFSQPMRAIAAGQANFAADPADVTPLHDMLVYEPPSPAVDFTKVTYGVSSLFIGNPADVLFKAVDDTLNASATNPTSLPVMLNDLKGLSLPVTIDSFVRPSGFQGNLVISGENIVYTPPANFAGGTQQFTYRLRNSLGATQDATVTMQIGNNTAADDTVQIRLAATDAVGTPITSVNVGDTFQIRAFVKDLRTDDGDGNAATDRRGVYAAYFDLLYSFRIGSIVPSASNTLGFDITFGANYLNGKSGDAQVPGIVDESGAFQSGSNPLGANEQFLYVTTFKAEAAGTFAFQPDPANEAVVHDVLTFEPASAVPVARLRLSGGTIQVNGGAGEGEFTNPSNHLDVNNDGYVSAIDALLVINDMNSNGARQLGGGEGEAGTTHQYVDVNADRYVTAIDALMVINHLNGAAGGEGELLAIDSTLDVDMMLDPVEASTEDTDPMASPDKFEILDDLSMYSMIAQSAADDDLANEEQSVDVIFDELGEDVTTMNDSPNGPRVIFYNMRGEDRRNPEEFRRRREGYRDLFDELAHDAVRFFRSR